MLERLGLVFVENRYLLADTRGYERVYQQGDFVGF
jgi:hypothetical protein